MEELKAQKTAAQLELEVMSTEFKRVGTELAAKDEELGAKDAELAALRVQLEESEDRELKLQAELVEMKAEMERKDEERRILRRGPFSELCHQLYSQFHDCCIP